MQTQDLQHSQQYYKLHNITRTHLKQTNNRSTTVDLTTVEAQRSRRNCEKEIQSEKINNIRQA